MQTEAIASSNTTPYTTGSSGRTISSDFETFLHMLTTQIRNQDPLNPVEASDFAVQLATFSSVEQQVLTNDLLKGLSQQMNLSGLAQLGAWVGQDVRVAAPVWFDGVPVTITPTPAAGADAMELVVTDPSGTEVQRIALPLSSDPVDWAGMTSDGAPLPRGLYHLTVESLSGDSLLRSDPVQIYARVEEVRVTDGGLRLVLPGGVEVESGDVTALRHG
ncbi:MAG: flagellar hook assembly protein FlgD [Rubellimicrobium sp.]|nr:flagellar hook assembly protein FlgD [Rubellimicrobium sp.]